MRSELVKSIRLLPLSLATCCTVLLLGGAVRGVHGGDAPGGPRDHTLQTHSGESSVEILDVIRN